MLYAYEELGIKVEETMIVPVFTASKRLPRILPIIMIYIKNTKQVTILRRLLQDIARKKSLGGSKKQPLMKKSALLACCSEAA